VIFCALFCLFVGILSAFVAGGFYIYDELCLPESAPPGFVFPIIWSVLYLLIGAASGVVIATRERSLYTIKLRGIFYFCVMLALNFLWAPAFFGGGLFFVGFVIICAMLVLSFFVLLCYSNISLLSALVIFVYMLWLLYAAYLNLAILFLNG
jgi:tryptophan-rich sensory protein